VGAGEHPEGHLAPQQRGCHRGGVHRVLQEHLQGLLGPPRIHALQRGGRDRVQIDFVLAEEGPLRHDGQLLVEEVGGEVVRSSRACGGEVRRVAPQISEFRARRG